MRARPALANAQRIGLYRGLMFPVTGPAAATRAVASRDLTNAWQQGLLRTSVPRVRRDLDALARTQAKIDRATVGVFVGPVEAKVPR